MAQNETTGTGLTGAIQKYLAKKLLSETDIRTPLANSQHAVEGEIPKNNGQYIEYRLFGKIGLPGLLAEATDPATGQVMSSSVVQVPIQEMGDYIDMSNLLLATDHVKFLDKCYDKIKEALKRQMNNFTQEAMLVTATTSKYGLSFTNTKFPTIYANAKAAFANLVSDDFITMDDFLRGRSRLANSLVPSFGGYYVAVICPAIRQQLEEDPKFLDLVKRHEDMAKKTIIPGHLMDYRGIRWVEQDEPFQETLGGTEGTRVAGGSVLSAHMYGEEAFGYLGLSGMNAKIPKFHYQDITKTQCNPTLGYRVTFRANTLQPTRGLNIKGLSKYSETNG